MREGYLIEREGKGLSTPVFQLSKKGFDFLKFELGELTQMRFAAQSVTHDYIATAFQIGEFVDSQPSSVQFLTEQEIQCTHESILPDWLPKARDHIPDGFTRIEQGTESSVFAFEVELNLKPMIRYDKAAFYFDLATTPIDAVFWLCDGAFIANAINKRLQSIKLGKIAIHSIVFLEEFKRVGWQAPIYSGQFKGKTVSEVIQSRVGQGSDKGRTRPIPGESTENFLRKTEKPMEHGRLDETLSRAVFILPTGLGTVSISIS